MSKTYKVTLSDAENKALGVFAFDQNEWIQNLVHERCRIAIDEIASMEIQKKLEAGETITGSKEDIVLAADIESAASKEARMLEEFKKEQQG